MVDEELLAAARERYTDLDQHAARIEQRISEMRCIVGVREDAVRTMEWILNNMREASAMQDPDAKKRLVEKCENVIFANKKSIDMQRQLINRDEEQLGGVKKLAAAERDEASNIEKIIADKNGDPAKAKIATDQLLSGIKENLVIPEYKKCDIDIKRNSTRNIEFGLI